MRTRASPSSRTLLLLYAADLAFRLRWEIGPALDEGPPGDRGAVCRDADRASARRQDSIRTGSPISFTSRRPPPSTT